MSTKQKQDFSNLFKNRLEERIVNHLEQIAALYENNDTAAIETQLALVGRSLEGIAMMLAEQGYVANNGRFTKFTPGDLLTIQQALSMAMKMRNDILLIPTGVEAIAKVMKASTELPAGKNNANPNTGLSEPPPLVPVDQAQPAEHKVESPIADAPEMMHPVLLPLKK